MDNGLCQFPNIYFGTEHIGGYDDLKSYLLCDGEICRLINQNGIKITTTGTDSEELENAFIQG